MTASPDLLLDVLSKDGKKTGISKSMEDIYRDGDYYGAVRVLIFAENTQQLLLQQRADCLWDVTTSGVISAGNSSLLTARKELLQELGIKLPSDAFELLFSYLGQSVKSDGEYVTNEYNDVYLITTLDPIPLEAFTLQESKISGVKYISWEEYRSSLAKGDPNYVSYDVNSQYGKLFEIISKRYKGNVEERSAVLEKKISRYARVSLSAELTGVTDAEKEALGLIITAAKIMDEIYFQQVWGSNPSLRDWLKEHASDSRLDKLKWMYYQINGTPWSTLDENEPFLSTADSAIKLLPEATKPVNEWKGLQYRTAFPLSKPAGANFYPQDMDKMEFELWKDSLSEDQKKEATGFFNTIRRQSESKFDADKFNTTYDAHVLYSKPYSQEYTSLLSEAADLLHKAGDLTSSPSLKSFLHSKASAFLSNDYYDSDIAWMRLDSKLDITIGPYETYKDALFGYKATFEAFIGIRDDEATSQVKLFGDNLQLLEENLPLDQVYKSKNVSAAPIRVVNLVYNGGDVKGTTSVAFNLPNDERIVKEHGTSMVMLKNVSEAKFNLIFLPIADVCISEDQRKLVDFESFYAHVICHECCHGIGPHGITLPNGKQSTVRMEMQELHSALEEAKADIVGLWALRFLIEKNFLPKKLIKTMYVSFLTGCFRSVRFGLKKAHGKGQALQFNYLFEKGAFVLMPDQTFSVDFNKVENAVESLSREILTTQGRGDKAAAMTLLQKYSVISQPLTVGLQKLEKVQVPVDIVPDFPIVEQVMTKTG